MRKTLVAVAFAGAALAPAAALTTAATLATATAPTAALAAPKAQKYNAASKTRLLRHRSQRNPALRRGPLTRRPDFQIARRCFWPRVSIRHEIRRLRHGGYRQVRYLGRTTHQSRCALFVHFSACRGARRYKVIVRFLNNRRFVITQRRGLCLRSGPVPRRP